jgi:hypothetical protein
MQITQVLDGTSGPFQGSWSAPDLTTGFGSVVVFNQSNSALSVWLSQLNTAGAPTFVVPAGVAVTYPIPGTQRLTVELQVHPTTGTCTVTLVDSVLSASSSIVPFAGDQLVGVNGFFTLPGSSIVVQWGEVVLVPSDFSTGSVLYPHTYLLGGFCVNATAFPAVSNFDNTAMVTVDVTGFQSTGFQYRIGGSYPGDYSNIFWFAVGV